MSLSFSVQQQANNRVFVENIGLESEFTQNNFRCSNDSDCEAVAAAVKYTTTFIESEDPRKIVDLFARRAETSNRSPEHTEALKWFKRVFVTPGSTIQSTCDVETLFTDTMSIRKEMTRIISNTLNQHLHGNLRALDNKELAQPSAESKTNSNGKEKEKTTQTSTATSSYDKLMQQAATPASDKLLQSLMRSKVNLTGFKQ